METRSSLRHWLTLSTQWFHLFPTKSSRSRLWSLGQCKDSDQRSSGRAHHATRTFAIASNWRSPGCEQCGGFGTEPVVSPATAYIHTMCSLFHIWAPQRLCDALYSGWPKLVATFWKIQTELLKIWWVLTLEIHSNQRTAENNALFTMFEEKHFFLRSCMNANKLQITLCRHSLNGTDMKTSGLYLNKGRDQNRHHCEGEAENVEESDWDERFLGVQVVLWVRQNVDGECGQGHLGTLVLLYHTVLHWTNRSIPSMLLMQRSATFFALQTGFSLALVCGPALN